jgi:LysM repeat protein
VPAVSEANLHEANVHIVAVGETLSTIAEQYGTTLDALMSLNGISDPNLVSVGQRLLVPPGP